MLKKVTVPGNFHALWGHACMHERRRISASLHCLMVKIFMFTKMLNITYLRSTFQDRQSFKISMTWIGYSDVQYNERITNTSLQELSVRL